jgi:hypothetical protein
MIAFFIFVTIIGLLLVLVVYGTFAKNRWGINLDPVICPKCNKALATIRAPKSLRQVLWATIILVDRNLGFFAVSTVAAPSNGA